MSQLPERFKQAKEIVDIINGEIPEYLCFGDVSVYPISCIMDIYEEMDCKIDEIFEKYKNLSWTKEARNYSSKGTANPIIQDEKTQEVYKHIWSVSHDKPEPLKDMPECLKELKKKYGHVGFILDYNYKEGMDFKEKDQIFTNLKAYIKRWENVIIKNTRYTIGDDPDPFESNYKVKAYRMNDEDWDWLVNDGEAPSELIGTDFPIFYLTPDELLTHEKFLSNNECITIEEEFDIRSTNTLEQMIVF